MSLPRRLLAQVVEDKGWRPGTDLENRAALRLDRMGEKPDRVAQQHRVGRYRLDFAWPELRIALEVDGWHHLRPESAARDAQRDAELRALQWLTFRVDDREPWDRESGALDLLGYQVVRVVEIVNLLRERDWHPIKDRPAS